MVSKNKIRNGFYIPYYRVSTDKQGRSGLGLEAQEAAALELIRSRGGKIPEGLPPFIEVETGKRADRPELAKALKACRVYNACLVIGKLDRLSRNVHFLSGLMESGVDFIACDLPEANRMTIHILAAVAEGETAAISARTKAALQAAKQRGVKLGNPCSTISRHAIKGHRASLRVRQDAARKRALDLRDAIADLESRGITSPAAIARSFNERMMPTARGHFGTWQGKDVQRVMDLIEKNVREP
jgi:DNA invertase Pin-like site-specific DNA recombinase